MYSPGALWKLVVISMGHVEGGEAQERSGEKGGSINAPFPHPSPGPSLVLVGSAHVHQRVFGT